MLNRSNATFFYAYLDAKGTQLVKLYGDPSIWMINETETEIDSSILTNFGRSEDMDFLWVLYAGVMVFFMQSGFTLLEAGMVRVTSVQNILFKNLMDACIGTISFFLFGYCIAYGDDASSNGFIGVNDVALSSESWNAFFFQWAFAATAATIVSGGVAERTTLTAYFSYTIWISMWVYPIVVHWVWSGTGWLSAFNETATFGLIDFAGSGVVHMVGGVSALMGAIFLGPRYGRFDDDLQKQYPGMKDEFNFGNNVPYQVLGTFILWFGWYGFNPGSTLAAQDSMALASKVAVNTTLAAALGGLTVAIIGRLQHSFWHVPAIANGVLAGLVAITAPCAVVEPWHSIIIGIIGACIQYGSSILLVKLKIDDPLDAFCVHGAAGFFGVVAAGLFAWNKDNLEAAGYATKDTMENPVSYGERLGWQILAPILIALWTAANTAALFGALKFFGVLRVSEEIEKRGLDSAKHGTNINELHGRVYSIFTGAKNDDPKKDAREAIQLVSTTNMETESKEPETGGNKALGDETTKKKRSRYALNK